MKSIKRCTHRTLTLGSSSRSKLTLMIQLKGTTRTRERTAALFTLFASEKDSTILKPRPWRKLWNTDPVQLKTRQNCRRNSPRSPTWLERQISTQYKTEQK